MKAISLNKVSNIVDVEGTMSIVLIDGSEIPIRYYFIHANEVKFE